jgi:hypothetical protein
MDIFFIYNLINYMNNFCLTIIRNIYAFTIQKLDSYILIVKTILKI